MNLQAYLEETGKKAKAAARIVASASSEQKIRALTLLSKILLEREQEIIEANNIDVTEAEKRGLDEARLARLTLTPAIIKEMADACLFVASLPDPLGAMESQWQQPNGLLVGRMRISLGVIAMIFESRPNVVIDSAILCLKAGNAVIMRGGSEALHSNLKLASLLHLALREAGLPEDAAQVLETADRNAIKEMCKLSRYIDVIIPRGGEALISLVASEATMPVLKHDKGVCHIYVDESADLENSIEIVYNSKVQRPSACNALECLLVHESVAAPLLPRVAEVLGEAGVSFHACPRAAALMQGGFAVVPFAEEDGGKEYLALEMGVRVVDSMEEAVNYIAAHGSNHSEVILTNNHSNAMSFLREVDASMIAVNASTRFNDGGQLGLGAEIGISTCKLHSYGPMGVKELTTTKFVVMGKGQIRT